MKRLAVAVVALAAASPSLAQTPDALCGTLDTVLAAAKEPEPFVSLVPTWKPTNMGGVIPAMAGLPATSQCRMRLAGTTVRGHLAGGPHNEFNCDVLRINSGKDGNAAKGSQDAAAGLIRQVSACLAAKGWTAAPLATRTAGRSDYEETVWSNASSKDTVVVEHEAQREDRDPTTTYRVVIRVRTPNPAPPKP